MWFCDSLRDLMPVPLANVALTIASVLCGAIVGSERQHHEKPAGTRTLILVTLGATIFTIASYLFTTTTGDSGRVAAQIVTGIGFLGGGVILHSQKVVKGVTTAASIWVMAYIGMCVGAGYAVAGLALSILVRVILEVLQIWEEWVRKRESRKIEIDFHRGGGRARVKMERILIDYRVPIAAAEWKLISPEENCVVLNLSMPANHLSELLDDLVSVPDVTAIRDLSLSDPASSSPPPKI
jgi:putative Mg2+ transporter-C (MgtC) family protein